MSKTANRANEAVPDVALRPARRGDAAALAVLVDIAGEGLPAHLWSSLKAPGQSILEFGRSRALRDDSDFSYSNAVIAEVSGEIAGTLIGYRLADPYETGDINAVPEVVRPLVLLEARAPGTWYVNVLALFPEFRGMGIGTQLLAAAAGIAREAGADALSIIVAAGNTRAARLYAHAGYRESAREPVVPFPGCPHDGDFVLMTRPVDEKQ